MRAFTFRFSTFVLSLFTLGNAAAQSLPAPFLAAPLTFAPAQALESPVPETLVPLESAVAGVRELGADATSSALHGAGRELETALTRRRGSGSGAVETGGAVFLYAPFGSGHEMAARALAKTYERRGVKTTLIDVTTYLPGWQTKITKKLYVWLFGHFPRALGWFFDASDKLLSKPRLLRIWHAFDSRTWKRLADDLVARRPDVILSTYMPNQAVERARQQGRLAAKFGVVVTDWRSHAAWVDARPDRFYVAGGTDAPGAAPDGRTVDELVARGVPRERIVASGIPIDPDIASVRPEPSSAKPTALVMGGGFGVGGLEKVVRGFKGAKDVHLEIVAGKNPEVLRAVERAVRELGLDAEVHAFVPHDRLMAKMAGSSLVITKPGGLTVTEATALSKPLVLIGPAHAQETGNAEVIVENEAGLLADGPGSAARSALDILRMPETLARLGQNARRLANTRAAELIADDLGR